MTLSYLFLENVYPEASVKEEQELMYDSVYATINDKNMSIDTSQSATPHQSASITPVQRLSDAKETTPSRSPVFSSADLFIRTAVNTAKRRLEASQNEAASENNYELDSADEYEKSHNMSGFSRVSKRNRSDLHPLVPIYNILAEGNVLENKRTLKDYQNKHNKLFDIES